MDGNVLTNIIFCMYLKIFLGVLRNLYICTCKGGIFIESLNSKLIFQNIK